MGDWNEPRPDWEELSHEMQREEYETAPELEGHNFPVEEDDGVCEDTAEINEQLEIAEQVMEDNKEVLGRLASFVGRLNETCIHTVPFTERCEACEGDSDDDDEDEVEPVPPRSNDSGTEITSCQMVRWRQDQKLADLPPPARQAPNNIGTGWETPDGATLNKMAQHLKKARRLSTQDEAKQLLLSDPALLEHYRTLKRW